MAAFVKYSLPNIYLRNVPLLKNVMSVLREGLLNSIEEISWL